jgi:photosystem II stability/assembly factor-like uncharacterized protein
MKKHSYILFILLLLCVSNSFAQQNWQEMMYDTTKNFYDIQAAFYEGCGDLACDSAPMFKQFKRWESHMEPRVYPTGVFDAETVFNEFLEVYNENNNRHNPPQMMAPSMAAPAAAASTTDWEFVGPIDNPKVYDHPSVTTRNGIGRVNAIAFHPTNTNIIYVGYPTGGIWKTTDGGSTWAVLSDFITNLGVSDIAIQNSNPNVIYWVTGDYDGGDTFFSKIMKSTNGGTTWAPLAGAGLPTGNNRVISRLAIKPNNANILIAATSSGVYLSTNGGTTFSQRVAGNFSSLEFKPGDPNSVYAGTRLNGRVYRSTNGGVSWGIAHQSGGYRTALAVTPNNPNVVYASFSNSSGEYHNSAKSTNSGVSWSNMSALPNAVNGIGPQCDYNFCIAAASDDQNFVHIGAVNLYRSTNGGSSWSQPYGDLNTHVDFHVLKYNPLDNKLYAEHDGGISVSDNDSYDWTYISDGLHITQFYNVGVSQSNSGLDVLFAGAQDNSLLYRNQNGWFTASFGDGVNSKIHKENENIRIGSIQFGAPMLRSMTSTIPYNPISPPGAGNGTWELPFEMAP